MRFLVHLHAKINLCRCEVCKCYYASQMHISISGGMSWKMIIYNVRLFIDENPVCKVNHYHIQNDKHEDVWGNYNDDIHIGSKRGRIEKWKKLTTLEVVDDCVLMVIVLDWCCWAGWIDTCWKWLLLVSIDGESNGGFPNYYFQCV